MRAITLMNAAPLTKDSPSLLAGLPLPLPPCCRGTRPSAPPRSRDESSRTGKWGLMNSGCSGNETAPGPRTLTAALRGQDSEGKTPVFLQAPSYHGCGGVGRARRWVGSSWHPPHLSPAGWGASCACLLSFSLEDKTQTRPHHCRQEIPGFLRSGGQTVPPGEGSSFLLFPSSLGSPFAEGLLSQQSPARRAPSELARGLVNIKKGNCFDQSN